MKKGKACASRSLYNENGYSIKKYYMYNKLYKKIYATPMGRPYTCTFSEKIRDGWKVGQIIY